MVSILATEKVIDIGIPSASSEVVEGLASNISTFEGFIPRCSTKRLMRAFFFVAGRFVAPNSFLGTVNRLIPRRALSILNKDGMQRITEYILCV